ncbi:MAG: DUF6156 family protein [Neptuniibacter sp.]
MPVPSDYECFYLSYSGISLPLKLVSPIAPESIKNRNTFFTEKQNSDGQPLEIVKFVYGEVDLLHQYTYDEAGKIATAHITDEDGEVQQLKFDDKGKPYPI